MWSSSIHLVAFKVVIYTGMLLVAVAGGGFMNKHAPKSGRAEFWSLFMFVTLAMSLAVSANNLILLFLSFEFLSITSYILAGFMREDQRSSEAGLKYFLWFHRFVRHALWNEFAVWSKWFAEPT